MRKHGKRYQADAKGLEADKIYPLADAIEQVKSFKAAKFDQSVEICFHLGIDPTHADQLVRGSLSLPHGIGVTRRVIAFCGDDVVKDAKAAGAIEAGGEELVKKVEKGWMDFDVAIASPDMMRVVSKLGRTLGPKGLMPSPKSGSVTPKVVDAVKEFVAGKVEFKNDKNGNVHAVFGKLSFELAQLTENAQTFIDTIHRLKPTGAKGVYVKKVSISATMTPGIQVEA